MTQHTAVSDYPIPIHIPELQFFQHPLPFELENGGALKNLTISYHTYGKLNPEGTNVIWVCHALTANSDVADWWSGLFGPGNVYDPERWFIVCANIIGSCYGSTCARSINPDTDKAYGVDFPLVTIRDIARAHDLLRQHLQINTIELCVGGSCGGHQALEFAYILKEKLKKMALLVCAARESAWAIAIHETQRMAIQADPTWNNDIDQAGAEGLRAARAVGLLTYRTIEAYREGQSNDDGRIDHFSAGSYVRYQGDKLVKRFYAQCYWHLTKTLDTHDFGRGRGGIPAALQQLTIPILVFSIEKDLLIPPFEQEMLAQHLPNAQFVSYDSKYGHDGFLVETDVLKELLLHFIDQDFKL